MVDISQQPDKAKLSSSTYRLVSSSPGHSTVFALVFPILSSLMSRVRGDVATIGLRAQAAEMTSHSHQCTTVTKIQTCRSQSTNSTLRQSHSSHNLKLPLRNPLMRLGDPVPILQDSRVFHASSPSEDGPLLTIAPNPNTIVSATFYIERRVVQITTKTIRCLHTSILSLGLLERGATGNRL